MKWQKFWSGPGNQKGFALLDLLVALVISGLIGAGVSMATVQVLDQSTRNSEYTMASRQAQNAVHWLSRDTQMAQTINGTSGFPLTSDITLGWVEWDHTSHQVVYSLTGDELRRSHSIDGGASPETLIARYINSVSENTSFEVELSTGNVTVATIRITATVGTGSRAVSVTKERQVIPRNSL